MGTLLHSALDPERRAECKAADAADRQADSARCDLAVMRAREDQRHQRPYWMFADLRPDQLRNAHPLAATPRPRQPDPHRFPTNFGALS
jgi:hypothetical protein